MIRIKICGITNDADAQAVAKLGADSIGFNFFEQSPRHISALGAARIHAQLPKLLEAIGVFVNAAPEEILSTCSAASLDAAQLHGDETPAIVTKLARSIRVTKAFRVNEEFSVATLHNYADVFAFLLDGAQPGQYGGTGLTTDWEFARRAARTHRIILAGGLKVENVAEAVRFVRPYAVDVASGVESKPGKKDHAKLAEFIQEVRRAEREPAAAPAERLRSA
jgi:phosphoribosylanthranilate isomerase